MELKKMREAMRVSSEFVAGSCGMSRQAYSAIENCRINPYGIKVQTLDLMAVFFKKSLDEMLHILVYDYNHT